MSGFFAGITTSFRISFVLLFIPFALRKRYAFLFGGVSGLLSSIAISWSIVGGEIWRKYFFTTLSMTGFARSDMFIPPSERVLPSLDIVYPTAVEGFDWNVISSVERYFADSSLFLPLYDHNIPDSRNILLTGFVLTTLLLLLCVLTCLPKNKNTSYLFLFGVLICLVGEFFIPISRYSYYDIQMLLPLLIVVSEADTRYLISRKVNIVLLIGLFLSTIGFLFIPNALLSAAFLIAFYVSVISVLVAVRDREEEKQLLEE